MAKTDTKIDTEEDLLDNKLITEMTEAGVLFGHKKSKTDPRMRPYIALNRQELEILDAQAVVNSLEMASKFIKETLTNNGLILFVSTKPSSRDIIKELADELSQPYVITRWLGGTLTNFGVIRKRIDHYEDLSAKKKGGELEKYTKKEQVDFAKKIEKLRSNFEGLTRLNKLPDLVFTVDIKIHSTAIREAKHKNIPIVAFVDTDDNPKTVDYPIIANDHARSSVEWVINRIREDVK